LSDVDVDAKPRIEPGRRLRFPVLAAIFLLSCAGLIFEIVLTRLFSATIWYHFTFVAMSVALFGWGIGGFALELSGLRAQPDRAARALLWFAALFGVSVPLFLVLFLSRPASPDHLELYFVGALIPFLFGGMALALSFQLFGHDTNRLYFADLLGASMGTLLVPLLLGTLGAETTVLTIGVLPLAAGLLLLRSLGDRVGRVTKLVCVALLVAVAALAVANRVGGFIRIDRAPTKALYKVLAEKPDREIVYDEWNAYSRITAVSGFRQSIHSRIFIDSDAWTNVVRWDGKVESLRHRREAFRFIPFRFHERPQVMIIGPGGGAEIRLALLSGSPQVTAVEMNPLIVDYVKQVGAEAGNVYNRPDVKLVMSEGRNFVRRTDQRYDVILLGFVDSWAAVSSGGLSLTENYLYTADAFREYYDRLTDTGTLVIMRWPTDIPRCVANAVHMLGQQGLSKKEAGRRILAVSKRKPQGKEPVPTLFLLRKSPFPPEQVQRILSEFPDSYAQHAPGVGSASPYGELLAGRISLQAYDDAIPTKADPVTDDRPFYFATVEPHGIPDFMIRLLRGPLIAVLLVLVIVVIQAFRTHENKRALAAGLPYFALLGAGFIMVEVALIHKLILLLGHPIFALCVLLFFTLLWSSLGSLSGRWIRDEKIRRALLLVLPGIGVVLGLALLAVPWAIESALHLGVAARVAVSAALLLPVAFLMGLPFPLGLRQVHRSRGSVAVMWGVNGVMSVVGSNAAMVIAVMFGFSYVIAIGAACYLVALVPVFLWRPGRAA
jgi:predicted membrane-bound spermidine synthase